MHIYIYIYVHIYKQACTNAARMRSLRSGHWGAMTTRAVSAQLNQQRAMAIIAMELGGLQAGPYFYRCGPDSHATDTCRCADQWCVDEYRKVMAVATPTLMDQYGLQLYEKFQRIQRHSPTFHHLALAIAEVLQDLKARLRIEDTPRRPKPGPRMSTQPRPRK